MKIFILSIFLLFSFGVLGYELDRKLTEKEKELVQIYEKYSKEKFGDIFGNYKYTLEITEAKKCWDSSEEEWNPGISIKLAKIPNNECWRVTFGLPENMIGGTPVIFIDKKTLEVMHAYGTQ